MRLLLASLFVFGILLLVVVLIGEGFEHISPFIIGPLLAVLFVVLCLVAMVLFNPGPGKPLSKEERERKRQEWKRQIREWEEQGLITTTTYQVKRAFEVEEMGDEGKHFFLELQDGSVLYLNGQYFYDFALASYSEEDEDENEENGNYDEEDNPVTSRTCFPSTKLTFKRHQDGAVIAVLCQGEPIEYETLDAEEYWSASFWADGFPLDEDIITGRTFDQLKNVK